MLGIKVGDDFLELGSTQVDFRFNNPMFDSSSVDRGYSWSFNLELTPHNKSVLNHVDRIDSSVRTASYNVWIFLYGSAIMPAILKVLEVPGKLQCHLETEALSAAKSFEQVNIRDLGWEDIDVSSTAGSDAAKAAAWVTHMNSFIGANLDDVTHFFPAIESFQQAAYNQNHVINPVGPQTHFPSFTGIVNPYLDGTYISNPAASSNLFSTKDFDYSVIPLVRTFAVLDKIAEYFSYTGHNGDWYDISEMKRLLILNNTSLDNVSVTGVYPSQTFFNIFSEGYNLKNHLPDLTVLDFYKQLCSTFFLQQFVGNNSVELTTIKSLITSQVDDWTMWTDEGFSFKRVSSETGYSVVFEQDPNDDETKNGFEQYLNSVQSPTAPLGNDRLAKVTELEGGFEHTISGSTTSLGGNTFAVTGPGGTADWHQVTPRTQYQFSSEESYLEDETIQQLRQVLYRGLQPGNDMSLIDPAFDNTYPMATFDNLNPYGEFTGVYIPTRIGDYSLGLDGDDGLINKFGLEFLDLMSNGKIVDKLMRLPVAILKEALTWRQPRKKIHSPQGTMIGVIKSIEFSATESGISTIKVTFCAR